MAEKLEGQQAMQGKINAVAKAFPAKVRAALYRRGEAIMTRSKDEFVPVDLAVLKNSGYVSLDSSGNTIAVNLSYGGAASAYALAVHEHPSGFSPPSWRGTSVTFQPPGRGPKYLERPLMEAIGSLPRDLGNDLELTRSF